ncbi:response regulator transcription factor [Paraburkholderia sp. Ac-20347]|uniref:response regulator transcription factor n=1 Tax=Paraburkholderia sp. Ac-20347 TaxID=2703892 RepID=UPI0019815B26|nr:response regulator transcription factor [Paraburkholderia sp. Ac-20347]MBN3814599.1 response regulator transcription factor [Paraburkholderia sp. Ac-20347]
MRIALVEPDARHAELVERLLIAGGHACRHFAHAAPLMAALEDDTFDLLIAAHWCGDQRGDDLIPHARRLLPGLPAIVLMASPHESEIVGSLQAGADDCISKPVRGPEMLARIDALLRRAGVRRPRNRARHGFGDYLFDSARYQVSFRGQTVTLTPKEFRFALLLFTNASRPVSRARILETVWNLNRDVRSRTLDTHASRLRSKLQLGPEHGWRLTTLYGFGYQLERLPISPAE